MAKNSSLKTVRHWRHGRDKAIVFPRARYIITAIIVQHNAAAKDEEFLHSGEKARAF